jgi:hypothetical protein
MKAARRTGVLRSFAVAGLCLALAGCGHRTYSGAARYPLSGRVTVDGVPVDVGSISFIPLGGDEGGQRVCGGVIDDGAYSVPEAQGANAGPYRVEIHWAKKTGKMIKDLDGRPTDERREGLPDRYHKTSELTVEVSADKTTFDFDLRAK